MISTPLRHVVFPYILGFSLALCLIFIGPFVGDATLDAQERPSLGLENPYQSIFVHLYYLQKDSYDPNLAASPFKPMLDSIGASKAAIKLKQVYDGKGLYVYLNLLPRDSNYIDSLSGKAVFYPFPKELPSIFLEQQAGRWVYSRSAIEQVNRLHQEVYPFGADRLVNLFSNRKGGEFLGLSTWQYLGIGLILVLIFLLYFLFTQLINPLIRRLSKSRLYPSLVEPNLTWKIARYLSALFVIRLLAILLPPLQLPIVLMEYLVKAIELASIVLIVFILFRIIDIIILFANKAALQTSGKLDEQLIPIVKRLLHIIIFAGGVIQILRLLEVNVTALIAGVSIGGLALALAAQDTVKNLIGSATIFFDKPFQIGDWIIGSGFSGAVVEVGFRTTRIQRPDSSILSVPNGSIVNMAIQNLGVRSFRLLDTTLNITYNTSPEKIEAFLAALKEILDKHPATNQEESHVYLSGLSNSSIDIFFRAPVYTSLYADELRFKEEIILEVLRAAERLDVDFAFPSTSVYVEKFPEK